MVVKLIRMVRLPRILKVFNVQKFKKHLQVFVTGSTRAERIGSQITVRKVYSIFRLISITFFLIYFLGCIYYFIVQVANSPEDTPDNTFEIYMPSEELGFTNFDSMAVLLYFSMTTVAKIGYGDMTPQSNVEKLCTVVILLTSMIFFSYVLDQFIFILQKDPSPKQVI